MFEFEAYHLGKPSTTVVFIDDECYCTIRWEWYGEYGFSEYSGVVLDDNDDVLYRAF